MRRSLLLAVVLLLGAPHSAQAGTVAIGTMMTDYKYQYESPTLEFRAAPGERNRIVVTRVGTGSSRVAVLHDEGAPVTAPSVCTAVDERTVSCPNFFLDVDAGDGDDTVTVMPGADEFGGGYIRGGEGSDALTGQGFLAGGPGNDVLSCPEPCRSSVFAGGAGDDRLTGGSADDVLSGDGDGPPRPITYETRLTDSPAPGSDIIDGGPGRDTLTFRERRLGVAVDLGAKRAAGTGGERDRLAGIEHVDGGDGDDLLIGDAADNQLQGDGGDDRIDGRAGNDYLLGNLIPNDNEFGLGHTPPDPGADTLRGGDGDDRLDAGGERGDVLSGGPGDDTLEDDLSILATRVGKVRCGSGRDVIDFAPRGQLLSDCELLRPTYTKVLIALRPTLRAHGRLRFAWTCQHPDGCVLAAGVRVRSSPLTRRQTSTQAPARRAFLVRPRPPARRGDIADITIVVQDAATTAYGARWRIKL